jgi:hypothetical protein
MKNSNEVKKEAQIEAQRIIDAMGGPSAVARIFSITPGAVTQWRVDGVPDSRMFSIKLLRPDLFKSNSKKLAKG